MAQTVFDMPWPEIIGLPSRYSTEAPGQTERAHLLERVATQGYISGYSGVRITRSGKRFLIQRATVWNLLDPQGKQLGQAACFMPNL